MSHIAAITSALALVAEHIPAELIGSLRAETGALAALEEGQDTVIVLPWPAQGRRDDLEALMRRLGAVRCPWYGQVQHPQAHLSVRLGEVDVDGIEWAVRLEVIVHPHGGVTP